MIQSRNLCGRDLNHECIAGMEMDDAGDDDIGQGNNDEPDYELDENDYVHDYYQSENEGDDGDSEAGGDEDYI